MDLLWISRIDESHISRCSFGISVELSRIICNRESTEILLNHSVFIVKTDDGISRSCIANRSVQDQVKRSEGVSL